MPGAATWYTNPVFLASLGAFTAMGVLMMAAAYFVMTKMKPQPGTTPFLFESPGYTCRSHEGLAQRVATLEKWIDEHKKDYQDIRDAIMGLKGGKL
jgi:hypothetical protein